MKKREPAAAVTARSRKFRQRKLNKNRAANEVFYRNLLQKYYEAHGLELHDWVFLDGFFDEMLSPITDKTSFAFSLRFFEELIETGVVYSGDGPGVEIIRLRYFLD